MHFSIACNARQILTLVSHVRPTSRISARTYQPQLRAARGQCSTEQHMPSFPTGRWGFFK